MATRPWIFQINTFDVNTRGSNVKMLSLATDTDAKLQNENADPDILELYNLLHPVYDTYRLVCINYDMAAGDYEGETLAFESIMDSIPTEVRKWEGGVRAVYFEDTPEEKAIFPNKRNPFLNGTYEDRLSAIGTLAAKLNTDPALAATYTLVNNFYTSALAARLAQQQDEGALGQLSDLREQQRLLVAQAMYGVLGGLMLKFMATPDQIDRFFDLQLLRRKGEGQVTGPATMVGTITDNMTLTPIVGARVVFRNAQGETEVFTDAEGRYSFSTPDLTEVLEAEMEVSAPAYATQIFNVIFEPATEQTLDVALNPTP